MILVTDHIAREWSRMAQAAFRCDRNDIGFRYSMASACLHRREIPADQFHSYQGPYRAWLVFGEWPTPDEPVQTLKDRSGLYNDHPTTGPAMFD